MSVHNLVFFFKGMPFSVYGNAMIPPVAPLPDGAGGPIFNGLPYAADPLEFPDKDGFKLHRK